jgi:subtilisin inhibitor-like
MRKLAVATVAIAVAAAATAALAVAVTGSSGGTPTTSLTITYWSNGASGSSAKWTLKCNPAGGTLRAPSRACAKLRASSTKLFAPVSPKLVCTQIYGGPEVARVVGKLRGVRVAATFDRTDGCGISRWSKVSPWLLPRGGVT